MLSKVRHFCRLEPDVVIVLAPSAPTDVLIAFRREPIPKHRHPPRLASGPAASNSLLIGLMIILDADMMAGASACHLDAHRCTRYLAARSEAITQIPNLITACLIIRFAAIATRSNRRATRSILRDGTGRDGCAMSRVTLRDSTRNQLTDASPSRAQLGVISRRGAVRRGAASAVGSNYHDAEGKQAPVSASLCVESPCLQSMPCYCWGRINEARHCVALRRLLLCCWGCWAESSVRSYGAAWGRTAAARARGRAGTRLAWGRVG